MTTPENAARQATIDSPDAPRTEQHCGCGAPSKDQPQMPEVTFTTFVLSLASSALVQLGEVPDPQTGETTSNILMAKHTIDVLNMLRKKTQGCLDEEEARLMEGMLYELRMKYVLKAQ